MIDSVLGSKQIGVSPSLSLGEDQWIMHALCVYSCIQSVEEYVGNSQTEVII
jgi:hypothetical protein